MTNTGNDCQILAGKSSEIEQYISECVMHTFKLMFNLEVAPAKLLARPETEITCASVRLRHVSAEATLSIFLPQAIAALLSEQLGLDSHSEEGKKILQDITCEITNIVGNNLRTYFSEKMGVYFDLNLVTPGEICLVFEAATALKLQFKVKSYDPIELDFAYATTPKMSEILNSRV